MTTETPTTPEVTDDRNFTELVHDSAEAASLALVESTTALDAIAIEGFASVALPTPEQLTTDADRMAAIIEHDAARPARKARKTAVKTAAEGFAALDQQASARASTRRPRSTESAAAKAARQQAKAIRDADLAAQEKAEQKLSPTKKAAPGKSALATVVAAGKREMAEDRYGKYIRTQTLQGMVVTALDVERELDGKGKPQFLTARYEVRRTLNSKVLGQIRFDHGAWFVVGDNDETKVPSISKGIQALAK
jgi:hypothetical protein